MPRGLGELQKNQKLETYYKILTQLHKRRYSHGRPLRHPLYSYEALWKQTGNDKNSVNSKKAHRARIHRNILRERLEKLVSKRIIFRGRYRRPLKRSRNGDVYFVRLKNYYVYFVDEKTSLRTSKALIKQVYYPHQISLVNVMYPKKARKR